MSMRRNFGLILLGQIALLAILGWRFRSALNSDGVAYLQLARYYAEGNFSLAISGYWGPGLSWLLALGLKIGLSPLVTARVVMGLSAMAFTWGAHRLFRAISLNSAGYVGGVSLVALAGAWWSVQFITPDLLLSGVWLLVLSWMLRLDWTASWWSAALVGAGWGVAYLIKAISLPLGVVTLVLFGIHALRQKSRSQSECRLPMRVIQSVIWAGLVMALVAAPWIMILSLKYERLTFSTTPSITHTLTGPPDVDRYHPFARTFQTPEPGRLTSWEEPSQMDYQVWSPWASGAYARHQVQVLGRNLLTLSVLWCSINLGALFWCWVWARASRESVVRRQLSALLILPLGLVLVYLPCFFTLTEQRFFYVTLPLFYAASLCWLENAPRPACCSPRVRLILAWGFVVVPLLAQIALVRDRLARAGEAGQQLADKMRAVGVVGPLAGSANLPGGRTGLYVAFHLQQPWQGDKLAPTPEEIAACGAKYFLVCRDSTLAQELEREARFENLDARLFNAVAQEAVFPVQVFEIHPERN